MGTVHASISGMTTKTKTSSKRSARKRATPTNTVSSRAPAARATRKRTADAKASTPRQVSRVPRARASKTAQRSEAPRQAASAQRGQHAPADNEAVLVLVEPAHARSGRKLSMERFTRYFERTSQKLASWRESLPELMSNWSAMATKSRTLFDSLKHRFAAKTA